MEWIKTFEELNSLAKNEKFFVFRGGNIFGYYYAGLNPYTNKLAMAVSDANVKTVECFSGDDFHTKQVIMKGKYDSKEAGEIMICQLQERIESIKKIYLKKA